MVTHHFVLKKICGLESEAVKNEEEQFQLIYRHVTKLNQHPLWSQSRKIFIPENNYGIASDQMQTYVKAFKDITTYWEKNRPGVLKTHVSTNEMQKQMVSCLFKRHLKFEHDMFTQSRNKKPANMLALCREQLETYHWESTPPKDAFSKTKWTMTGKVGSKQDDLYIVVAMAYKYGMEILTNPHNDVFTKIPDTIQKRIAQVEEINV
jgi:hypothetical protein